MEKPWLPGLGFLAQGDAGLRGESRNELRLTFAKCKPAISADLHFAKLTLSETSTPVLRPMPDVQDFESLISGTVHNDVRRDDKLAGSSHLSGPAKAGEVYQLFDAVDNRLSNVPGSGGVVLLDSFNGGFKLVRRFGCPPNLSHD